MFKYYFIVSLVACTFLPIITLFIVLINTVLILRLMVKFRKKKSDVLLRQEVPICLRPGIVGGILGGCILISLTMSNVIQPGIWFGNAIIIKFSTILLIAGSFLHLKALLTLGEMFNAEPSIVKNQKVITQGPYTLIRHPIYLAFFIYNFCFLLLSGNIFWIILLSGYALLWSYTRASIEEKMLSRRLNDRYYSYYNSNIPMLFPTFRSIINFVKSD